MPDRLNVLLKQATQLAQGAKGHAPKPQPGWLPQPYGRSRDPALHAKIVALLDEAVALEAAAGDRQGFARLQRGLQHLNVGHLELARADLEALRALGSDHAEGSFPIWLALKAGDKAEAGRHLEAVNARNREQGLPKQSLADFRY